MGTLIFYVIFLYVCPCLRILSEAFYDDPMHNEYFHIIRTQQNASFYLLLFANIQINSDDIF